MASCNGKSSEIIKAKLVSNPQHKGLDPEYILGANCKTEFTIGRNVSADCLILDVQVSRCHATFKYDGERSLWVIHDQGSQDGVRVNGKPLKSKDHLELKNGDKISINDYEWAFWFPAEEMPNSPGNALFNGEISQLKSAVAAKVNEKLASITAVHRKIKESEERQKALTTQRDNLLKLLKAEKEKFTANQNNERKKFEQRLSETKKEIAEAERRQFEKKMQEDAEKMEQRQKEMTASSEEKLKKVTDQVEETVKQKDALEAEIARLKSDAAKEKDAKEKEKTEREKMAVELKTKNDEIAKLNEALQNQQKRNEGDEVSARKKLKLDFMSHCSNELKCPICDELFIDPMGLDCGHVYCDFCINQWKSTRKENFTCPNCRKKVETCSKSLHIKNLIDGLFEGADASLKAEREEVIKERIEHAKAASKPTEATQKNSNFLARAPGSARPSAPTRTGRARAPGSGRPSAPTRTEQARAPGSVRPSAPTRTERARAPGSVRPSAPTGTVQARPPAAETRSNGVRPNPRPVAPAGQVVRAEQRPQIVDASTRPRAVSPVALILSRAQGLIRNRPSLNATSSRGVPNQVSQRLTINVFGANPGRRRVNVRILNPPGAGTSASNAVVDDGRTVPDTNLE